MTCPHCKNITVCTICGKGYAEAMRSSTRVSIAPMGMSFDAQGKLEQGEQGTRTPPTEVDSMNRLRVQAERRAKLYRRALELACNGDDDQVAFFVSEAGAEQDDAAGVALTPGGPK